MYHPDYYVYSTQWDDKIQTFKAWVAEFPNLVAYSSSLGRALSAVKAKVKKELEELGETAPEPLSLKIYSGKLILRMPESLHRKLAQEATQEGVSLNQWITLQLKGGKKRRL